MGALKRTDLLAPEGTPTPSQVSAQTSLADPNTRAASHSATDSKVATAPEAATCVGLCLLCYAWCERVEEGEGVGLAL
eukprot:520683-Pelagomonas_calceolata.AAC.1